MKPASAVIVAAGRGERFGSPKQFLPLGGLPLLLWSVRAFRSHPSVREVIVVLPPEVAESPPEWLAAEGVLCCAGGETRRESSGSGVRLVEADARVVLVHDAARPFVSTGLTERVIQAAGAAGAALPVLPVTDTIKRVEEGRIVHTIERAGLGRAQTPQGFDADLIRAVHERASLAGTSASDDAGLCEMEGHPVAAIDGDAWNLKITTPADFALAEWLVASGKMRAPAPGAGLGGSS